MSSIHLLLWPVRDHAHDLGFGRNFSVNCSDAPHLLNTASDSKCRHLEHQRVPGYDRTPKPRCLDPAEERYLFVAIFELTKRQDGTDLCQRFDLQHTGHHRSLGKMSGEKMLIDRHLLYTEN